jgi:hypothetical protein
LRFEASQLDVTADAERHRFWECSHGKEALFAIGDAV